MTTPTEKLSISDAQQQSPPKWRKFALILFGGLILGGLLALLMETVPFSPKTEDSQASLIAPQPAPVQQALDKLKTRFGLQDDQFAIIVVLSEQKLLLMKQGTAVASYAISGSAFGAGSRAGSNQTPLGTHKISEKIGDNVPLGGVFRSRMYKGEMAKIYTDDTDVDDDLVTTRIMWLRGQESGVNVGPGIDSHARFIYIHGTPEEGLIGRPASHGCIRMYNKDVIDLFNTVPLGTLVEIIE